jgi:hypothetical protein
MESEDGIIYEVCPTYHSTEAYTNAKHKLTQDGGLHYGFVHSMSFLERLFSITGGK